MKKTIKNILLFKFIIVSLIPISIISAFVLNSIENNITSQTILHNTAIVAAFSQELDRFLISSEQDIIFIAQLIADNRVNRDSIAHIIRNSYREYDDIMILDKNGIAEYTSNPEKIIIGMDFSEQEYFKRVKNNGKPCISEVTKSIEDSRTIAWIAVPEKDKIIVVSLNLDIIWDIIAKLQIDNSRTLFVTDRNGVYLAHKDPEFVAQREVFAPINQLPVLVKKRDTTVEIKDNIGEYYLSIAPVINGGWVIGMKIYKKDALLTLDKIINSFLFFLSIIVLAATIINRVFNKNIMKNFAIFNKLTREIREGNFDYEININSYIEFNLLAENFNTMSKNIKSRIEELKIKQAEITLLNNELEQRVISRTAELQATMIELNQENNQRKNTEIELKKAKEEVSAALEKEKEVNQMKTRFISMVSHEYRTPLTVILTSSFLLEKYALLQNTQMHSEHIRRIQFNVKMMTAMLEDVLFIGRSDSDRITIKTDAYDLDMILDEVVSSMQIADNLRHKIDITGGAWGSMIETDLNLIKQLLMNLISNAIKYSPAADKVDIFIEETDNFLILKIKDYGIGIPEENQEELFTPFFRANNVGAISGTGLGLTVAKRICNILKIDLTLFSKVNEGTEFILTIPKSYRHL